MSDVKDWYTDEAANSAASPDGAPESMTRSGVNDTIREIMAAVARLYARPDMREPFLGFTVLRTSGTRWVLRDDVETDALSRLEDGTRIRMTGASGADVGKTWEGFVDETVGAAPAYAPPDTSFGIAWIDTLSADTSGPANVPATIEIGPKELGRVAWLDTGTSAGQVPTFDELDPHVTTPEADLDVGYLGGEDREEITMAAARGRLNANGGLDHWQRGTSFTDTGAANSDENVCADNFTIISDGDDRVDVARDVSVPVDVPVLYSMKLTAATVPGNQKHGVIHFAEIADAFDVAQVGGSVKVSISFWAKVGAVTGIDKLRVAVLNLRTAAPTTHPVSAWNSGSTGVLGFAAGEWQLVNLGTPDGDFDIDITSTWAEFKVEGLAVDISSAGTGAIALAITTEEASIISGAEWHLAAVQFNRGDVALPFMRAPAAVEFARCLRYCETTFPDGTAPAHNQGTANALTAISAGSNIALDWRFAHPKFKTPTLETFNPSDAAPATGNWEDSAGTDRAVSSSEASTKGAHIFCTTATASLVHRIAAYVHANIWGAN